jgi:hypothetical protein
MLDAAIVVAETLSIRRRILCGDSCRHKNEGGIIAAGARICQLAQSASLRSGLMSGHIVKTRNMNPGKPYPADGIAGERFPYAETRLKTGEDLEGLD